MAYTTARACTTASTTDNTTANQIIPSPVTLAKHRPAGFAAGKNYFLFCKGQGQGKAQTSLQQVQFHVICGYSTFGQKTPSHGQSDLKI